jgi:hypothetical protein
MLGPHGTTCFHRKGWQDMGQTCGWDISLATKPWKIKCNFKICVSNACHKGRGRVLWWGWILFISSNVNSKYGYLDVWIEEPKKTSLLAIC